MAAPHIILYGHQGCPGTRAAKGYFKQHRMDYVHMDIGADPVARTEFQALGGFATPLILVNEQRLLGFDPEEFGRLWQATANAERGTGDG